MLTAMVGPSIGAVHAISAIAAKVVSLVGMQSSRAIGRWFADALNISDPFSHTVLEYGVLPYALLGVFLALWVIVTVMYTRMPWLAISAIAAILPWAYLRHCGTLIDDWNLRLVKAYFQAMALPAIVVVLLLVLMLVTKRISSTTSEIENGQRWTRVDYATLFSYLVCCLIGWVLLDLHFEYWKPAFGNVFKTR
jgi:hypothetical protein